MKQRFGKITAINASPEALFYVAWVQGPRSTFPALIGDGGELHDAFPDVDRGLVFQGQRMLVLKAQDLGKLEEQGQADIGPYQITLYNGWSWDRWREHCFCR